jgi:hypothetical protein
MSPPLIPLKSMYKNPGESGMIEGKKYKIKKDRFASQFDDKTFESMNNVPSDKLKPSDI